MSQRMLAYIKKKEISGNCISGLSSGLKDLKDRKLKFALNFIVFITIHRAT